MAVAKFSDNKIKQMDILDLIPETIQSEFNTSFIPATFNKYLTKDDSSRVAGLIGERNPKSLTNNQLIEATPHRQAYQLAPTMYSKVGTVETAMSFESFREQLTLLGIDFARFPQWANTTQFNWVPPINIDMLVNFQDYFWASSGITDPAQYMVVENRCAKSKSKVLSYKNVLTQRGELFAISNVNFLTNSFIVKSKIDDLFAASFVFFTKNSTNINVQNKFWTVASSSYDQSVDLTTITVQESIGNNGAVPPSSPIIGTWWFNTTNNTLNQWNGSAWIITSSVFVADISLSELAVVYQTEANCACNQDFGWDGGPWDDNQLGKVIWNTSLMLSISFATVAEWIAHNGTPNTYDIWYDTHNDQLKQFSPTAVWLVVSNNFSSIVAQTTGKFDWDVTIGCDAQLLNQWSEQNKWIHKSEVSSFSGVIAAQLPILEYNSNLELNTWISTIRSWKYRADVDHTFTSVNSSPSRLELEPIKGFQTVNLNGIWTVYLYDKTQQSAINVDYTNTFVPGFNFRITDDGILSDIYQVQQSEYRLATVSDPVNTQSAGLITVIQLSNPSYASPTSGGGTLNVRIEPVQTSQSNVWRGYHAHWVLDSTQQSNVPAGPQSVNPFIGLDDITSITPTMTSVGTQYLGKTFQEITVEHSGIDTIQLNSQFMFDPVNSTVFALAGNQDIRVYINGIRQYGSYAETVITVTPNYTVVGFNTLESVSMDIVSGVKFSHVLSLHDIIRIEVGSKSYEGMGMLCVPVRTVEDELTFFAAVSAGTQPTYTSLIQNRFVEQTKTNVNQYPLFNVYDVRFGNVIKTTNIFGFQEDPTFPVNIDVQRRIVHDSVAREFGFEQTLLDSDNHLLYGYRNTAHVTPATSLFPQQWWVNPLTSIIKGWDGNAWTDNVCVDFATLTYRKIIISATQPTGLINNLSLWYNPDSNTLSSYNSLLTKWTSIATPVVGADPSLQTIWKHGTNNEQSVPQYVDKNRNPIAVNDPAGDWQIPDQWIFNSEHNNKQHIKYSELVTHLSSIINKQHKIAGLLAGGVYTMTQDMYNYGVGGTIKEHNDNFDTLISSVNVNNITPLGVIEFAQQEYSSAILNIRDQFVKDIISLFTDISIPSILDISATISTNVTTKYAQNEFYTNVYGDTSAFNDQLGIGVKNWISTAPIFGLANKIKPHINVVNGKYELLNHDGHRSIVQVSTAESDRFSRTIIAANDTRTVSGKLGISGSALPPATVEAFGQYFIKPTTTPVLLSGVYWYSTSNSRQLYRFNLYTISAQDPSLFLNGVELPDGTSYFNTTTKATYQKSGLQWILVSQVGGNDISKIWTLTDFTKVLADVYLEIETELYNVSQNKLVFDFAALKQSADAALYDSLQRGQFNAFVVSRSISSPLVNTTYTPSNALTWNYASSIINVAPTIKVGILPAASWQYLYSQWYNTPYPHLEPWCLQGYVSKPDWWDIQYLDTTKVRKWKYNHSTKTGMWENIRVGFVPAGRNYPDGALSTGNPTNDNQQLPTYQYFSVNISDSVIAGGYQPDSMLPPYYDISSISSTLPTVRSLFTDLLTQIVAASADYTFGEVGPTEWMWQTSVQHVYDNAIIAFIMQPVRFMNQAFGTKQINVDLLQVETTFNEVYSHNSALFHGDLYNVTQLYKAVGINQWYVNFNRYSGFDTNTQFRQLWVNWSPKLTHQFASIVDTTSFEISNRFFDVIDKDYEILLVNTGAFKDVWVDAFSVGIISTPPSIIQYNNQGNWSLELNCLSAVPRTINYYNVKAYNSSFDMVTNNIGPLQFTIESVNVASKQFFVSGDQTGVFISNDTLTITNSPNNGTYHVKSSVFELSANRTRINVVEPIASNSSVGDLKSSVEITWTTGSPVVVYSTKILPAPLVVNTPYYLIDNFDGTFKIAETQNDAFNGIFVKFTSGGDGGLVVAEINSSFKVFGGVSSSTDVWYHFALDKTRISSITPPYNFNGIQTLINIIDGYAAYQTDKGLMFDVLDSSEFDPATGRMIGWQVETERFIDWAYGLRQSKINITDRFAVNANVAANDFTFVGSIPQWSTGTKVSFNTTGVLPQPLLSNASYYLQPTNTVGVVKISITSLVTDPSDYIHLTTTGSGILYMSLTDNHAIFPTFEINPTRNNIWLDTPQGLLANVIDGPYADIRVKQTIFDQYGRPLHINQLIPLRQDERSRIMIRPQLTNDVDPFFVNDPYNYIHMGGGHFFFEGYEHYILFNDYTVSGDLIYDQFLGLNTKKFNVDYFEKTTHTLRPTLGGFYLVGNHFQRNLEGSTMDMRNYYDVMNLSETTTVAAYSRSLVGYHGKTDYLDLLNINAKSQFQFYRGMIQSKGSVNSITAYVNDKRFVDAKIDEYWAWKIAEFGDSGVKVYPEIKLFATDSLVNDVRLQFLANSEQDSDPDVIEAASQGFNIVSFRNDSRWINFPEQRDDIVSPLFLDADITSMEVIYSGVQQPTLTDAANNGIQYWFDGTNLHVLVGTTWNIVSGKMSKQGNNIWWKTASICDDVRVIQRTLEQSNGVPDFTNFTTNSLISGTGVDQYNRINAEIVGFDVGGFTDIITIFTINPAKEKINPAKLIDTQSSTVVQNIPLWHPALGYHYYVAESNIDLISNIDPAAYTTTMIFSEISSKPWNQQEIGTIWVDSSYLDYVPYYDNILFPNVNDRLYSWGNLAPWGDTKVYQWVKSPIQPSQWSATADAQSSNTSIAANDKVTGTPRSAVYKRIRTPISNALVNVNDTPTLSTMQIPVNTVTNGQQVLFLSSGTFPTGVIGAFKYEVANASATTPQTFTLIDPILGVAVPITDAGVGSLTVVPAFGDNDWKRQPFITKKISAAVDLVGPYPIASTTVQLDPNIWNFGDIIDIYQNSKYVTTTLVDANVSATCTNVNVQDTMTIVRTIHTVTDIENNFDPDTSDDGTIDVQWKNDFEFTTNTTTTGGLSSGEITTTNYYFWVEGVTNKPSTSTDILSAFEIATDLKIFPIPYFVVQKPKDDPILIDRYGYGVTPYGSAFSLGTLSDQFYTIPVLYREAVIRNIAGYITDNDRYSIRFTRDFTLRDVMNTPPNRFLNENHEEWLVFRQDQPNTIPRQLWDKLTEALAGITLANNSVRVPALERELYDATYGTDTRFGLGFNQAFVDKTLALNTILSYLQDPTKTFDPVNIDVFFATNDFTTPTGIIQAMSLIYDTFTSTHVNSMWFDTLMDALSTKGKYKELFKTSWVAVHGIRILESQGFFDD